MSILNIFASYFDSFQVNKEKWIKELQEQWESTKYMPRKKKKRERKRILQEFSIATFNPFE